MEMWRKRRNFLADLARSLEDIYVTTFYPLNSRLYFLTYVRLFLKSYTTAKLGGGQKASWDLHAMRACVLIRNRLAFEEMIA